MKRNARGSSPRTKCAAGILVLFLAWPVSTFGQGPDEIDGDLDAETRGKVLERIVRALHTFYVVPEAVPQIEEHLRRQLQRGAYDEAITPAQFGQALTEDLRKASDGVQMAVVHQSETHPALGTAEGASAFHRLAMLPGNVGYLELPDHVDLELTKATAVSAMEFLAKADAIILDMRQNRGGTFQALHLLTSYFLGPQPLELYSRYSPCSDRMTREQSLTELPGKRLTQADVYILTSKKTVATALVLQQFRRAKIVGERTTGGGHLFRFVLVGSGFRLRLPAEELLHSGTGKKWEGMSVEPDIAVSAARALDVAHFELVKRLAAKAAREARRQQLGSLLPLLELKAKGAKGPLAGLDPR